MKKIYKAPTCSYLGKVMTQVICSSGYDLTIGGLNEGSDDKLVPAPDGTDADANKMGWDSFDKGF